jgi:hypothetical protein
MTLKNAKSLHGMIREAQDMAISEWYIDLSMYKLEITLRLIENVTILSFCVALCAQLAVLFSRAAVGILASVTKLKVVLG